MKKQLLQRISDRSARVCVIGMGYVGLPLAIAFGRNTLRFDPATLPPPPATLGVKYTHEVGFLGGTLFVDARQLTGPLQDGLALSISPGDDPPASTRLTVEGIPAETGTVTVRVQAVDAFFAIAVVDLEVTVNP